MSWLEVDGAGWRVDGGGWSWVEVGARFSNTHILYINNSYNHKKKLD